MNNTQKTNVNYCLNFFKGLACFAVVYLHTCYGSKITPILVCMARFAVPLFFVISGYYCINNKNNNKQNIIRKIKKTLKICLTYEVVYFVFNAIVYPFLSGKKIDILDYCVETFNVSNFLKFLFFNQSFDSGVLWFAYALLYCYIAMLFIHKLKTYKMIYVMGVALLLAHIIARSLIIKFTSIPEEVNEIWFRNFIFIGAPFFILGLFIKEYEKEIREKMSNNKIIIGIIIFGELLSFFERYFLPLEVFFGTTIVVFSLFILSLNNPQKRIWKPLCVVGEKYYMNEYYWHVITRSTLLILLGTLGISSIFLDMFRPIIVFLIIIIVTIIIRRITQLISINSI